MARVCPSILSADFSKLKDILRETELAGANAIHLDIMDGVFVPNLTFGPVIVRAIRKITTLPLYAHLMIIKPLRFIKDFSDAGVSRIFTHVESSDPVPLVLDETKKFNLEVGITLNPETPIEAIEPYLDRVDAVLVMSVHPGFSGQKFIPDSLEKVRHLVEIRETMNLEFVITIDGGIDEKTGKLAIEAGVDELVASSYVYTGKIRERIKKLKEL